MLRSVCSTVSIPELGETYSPRFSKYCPYGASPFPSQGSDGAEYGDQTVPIGMEAKMAALYGGSPSSQTSKAWFDSDALEKLKFDPSLSGLLRPVTMKTVEPSAHAPVGVLVFMTMEEPVT